MVVKRVAIVTITGHGKTKMECVLNEVNVEKRSMNPFRKGSRSSPRVESGEKEHLMQFFTKIKTKSKIPKFEINSHFVNIRRREGILRHINTLDLLNTNTKEFRQN